MLSKRRRPPDGLPACGVLPRHPVSGQAVTREVSSSSTSAPQFPLLRRYRGQGSDSCLCQQFFDCLLRRPCRPSILAAISGISRRATVTVTLSRSWRSWASRCAAPSVAISPAFDTAACSEFPGSNSGMGSFHRCLCKWRVLPAQFGVVYLLTISARASLLMVASREIGFLRILASNPKQRVVNQGGVGMEQ